MQSNIVNKNKKPLGSSHYRKKLLSILKVKSKSNTKNGNVSSLDSSKKITKRFQCNKCDFKTSFLYNLKRHTTNVHNIKSNVSPENIQIVCSKSSEIINSQKKFQCSKCDFNTKFFHNLKRHNIKIHQLSNLSSKDLKVPSKSCSRKQNPLKKFKCTECNFNTNCLHSFKRHNINSHTQSILSTRNSKSQNCSNSSKKSNLKSNISSKSQINSCSNPIKEKHCELCPYSTKRLWNLKKHVINVHRDKSKLSNSSQIVSNTFLPDEEMKYMMRCRVLLNASDVINYDSKVQKVNNIEYYSKLECMKSCRVSLTKLDLSNFLLNCEINGKLRSESKNCDKKNNEKVKSFTSGTHEEVVEAEKILDCYDTDETETCDENLEEDYIDDLLDSDLIVNNHQEVVSVDLTTGVASYNDNSLDKLNNNSEDVENNSICPLTSDSNENESLLSNSMESKTKKSEKEKFFCTLCNYSNVHVFRVRKHYEVVHEGVKPYKCNLCGLSSAYLTYIKRHIRKIHASVMFQEVLSHISYNNISYDQHVITEFDSIELNSNCGFILNDFSPQSGYSELHYDQNADGLQHDEGFCEPDNDKNSNQFTSLELEYNREFVHQITNDHTLNMDQETVYSISDDEVYENSDQQTEYLEIDC